MPRHRKTKREPVIFRKTKLCKFFAEGMCLRGAQCMWAHGEEELNTLPNFFRTQLCQAFMAKGVCKMAECTFAHSREELRQAKTSTGEDYRSAPGCLDSSSGAEEQSEVGALCEQATTAEREIEPKDPDSMAERTTLEDVQLYGSDGPLVHRKPSAMSRPSIDSSVSTQYNSLDAQGFHRVSGVSQDCNLFGHAEGASQDMREDASEETWNSGSSVNGSDREDPATEDDATHCAVSSERARSASGCAAQANCIRSRHASDVSSIPVEDFQGLLTAPIADGPLLTLTESSQELEVRRYQSTINKVCGGTPWMHHGPTGLNIRVRNTFMEFSYIDDEDLQDLAYGSPLAGTQGRRASIF